MTTCPILLMDYIFLIIDILFQSSESFYSKKCLLIFININRNRSKLKNKLFQKTQFNKLKKDEVKGQIKRDLINLIFGKKTKYNVI